MIYCNHETLEVYAAKEKETYTDVSITDMKKGAITDQHLIEGTCERNDDGTFTFPKETVDEHPHSWGWRLGLATMAKYDELVQTLN